MIVNISFKAWLGIFGIFGGPVLGLFTLGMFIPWASGTAALISAITSLLTLLWIALGGNISRLQNFYQIPQLNLSISDCERFRWNTSKLIGDDSDIEASQIETTNNWWLHIPIYELSYMW